jgi:hypothetical protein
MLTPTKTTGCLGDKSGAQSRELFPICGLSSRLASSAGASGTLQIITEPDHGRGDDLCARCSPA